LSGKLQPWIYGKLQSTSRKTRIKYDVNQRIPSSLLWGFTGDITKPTAVMRGLTYLVSGFLSGSFAGPFPSGVQGQLWIAPSADTPCPWPGLTSAVSRSTLTQARRTAEITVAPLKNAATSAKLLITNYKQYLVNQELSDVYSIFNFEMTK